MNSFNTPNALTTSMAGNHYSNFPQHRLACAWTFSKGNHIVFPLSCLGYPAQHHVYKMNPTLLSVSVVHWLLSLKMDKFIYLFIPHLFLHFPVDGHLGCSQFGAPLNNAAQMVLSRLLLDKHVPFSHIFRSGVDGPWGGYVIKPGRHCHTVKSTFL